MRRPLIFLHSSEFEYNRRNSKKASNRNLCKELFQIAKDVLSEGKRKWLRWQATSQMNQSVSQSSAVWCQSKSKQTTFWQRRHHQTSAALEQVNGRREHSFTWFPADDLLGTQTPSQEMPAPSLIPSFHPSLSWGVWDADCPESQYLTTSL